MAQFKIWGSYSGADEDSGLLICYAMLTGKELWTFWMIAVPSFSVSHSFSPTLLGYNKISQTDFSLHNTIYLHIPRYTSSYTLILQKKIILQIVLNINWLRKYRKLTWLGSSQLSDSFPQRMCFSWISETDKIVQKYIHSSCHTIVCTEYNWPFARRWRCWMLSIWHHLLSTALLWPDNSTTPLPPTSFLNN